MTFLPVVERELRVAARKRSTFWVRMVAALVAFAIGAGFICVAENSPFAPATLGRNLFGALSWISLIASLSAGLFLTADCLSEEKREGTLGFLFLTDLRGYDVVLGKLLSTSLRGLCALLAVFPMLAIPLLMGGVTGAQFWMTIVALLNALFISLAAGMFVSSISRDSQKAMAGTLLLLLMLAFVGPAIDHYFLAVTGSSLPPTFSYSSPVHLFKSAGVWVPTPFWPGLLVNQLIGWILLARTCVLLPRTWQDDKIRSGLADQANAASQSQECWQPRSHKRRTRFNRNLLDVNPALWLACQERWPALVIWGLTLLSLLFMALTHRAFAGMWIGFAPFTLILYLVVASQSARFFVESRRSGFFELLLSTPLSGLQIVQGQWRALLRMFGPALVVFLAIQGCSSFVAQQKMWKLMGGVTATRVATTNSMPNGTVVSTNTQIVGPPVGAVATSPPTAPSIPPVYITLGMAVMVTLTMAANLVAVAWFGMWMGVNSKNGSEATLRTIIFVQIIPYFVINFASGLGAALLLVPKMFVGIGPMSSGFMFWLPLLTTALTTILNLAKDLAFTLWARRKLYSEFRERAVRSVAPPALPLPIEPASLPNASLRTPLSSG